MIISQFHDRDKGILIQIIDVNAAAKTANACATRLRMISKSVDLGQISDQQAIGESLAAIFGPRPDPSQNQPAV